MEWSVRHRNPFTNQFIGLLLLNEKAIMLTLYRNSDF